MPQSSLEKHVAACRLRKLGYSKEEVEAVNPHFFYENAKVHSVVIDKAKQFQIIRQAKDSASGGRENGSYDTSAYSSYPVEVPYNHKRAICDLTSADRLAVYDFVTEEAKKQRSIMPVAQNESDLFEDLTAKINQDDGDKGPKSHLELMAEMRDYKRRRQSYRAKNVHITKKSYTEIIRDVIGVHMDELSNHWRDEMHDEVGSTVSSSSLKRRESQRSPSVESRQSVGSHRGKHRTESRRDRSRSPRRHRSREKESRKRERSKEKHHHHKRRKHN
ncbi:U11/U12 small nuclear ribonucleoprotein 48 kDa protein isoform X2 [Bombina bombina]|nr:U11/U12 small nuclear ribonucleoprotein 48 kDa protein isoform X2 [Bombina bombina]XP_053570698.1 U11/U12 small nuclear ribonucleoprotein 48 kDa protein isoform X2 [Bombina bombina]